MVSVYLLVLSTYNIQNIINCCMLYVILRVLEYVIFSLCV